MSLWSAPAKGSVQVGELPQQVLLTLGSLDLSPNGEDFSKPKHENLKLRRTLDGWVVPHGVGSLFLLLASSSGTIHHHMSHKTFYRNRENIL